MVSLSDAAAKICKERQSRSNLEDDITKAFWTPQKKINLTFVNPENEDENWYFSVPCLEMYEDPKVAKCPVADLARALFKESDELAADGATTEAEALKEAALAHWMKYSYYFQGFILKGGPDGVSDSDLMPILMPKSVHKLINDSVFSENASFEELPTGSFTLEELAMLMENDVPSDYTEDEFLQLFKGHNYVVKKTTKGGYNNYETSAWEIKQTDLTDEQLATIADNGLLDLRKYLPKRPTDEMYEVFVEMATVSIERELGEGDGHWNPEWETKYGLKPSKPRNASTESTAQAANGSGGSLKDRMKNRNASSDDDAASGTDTSKLTATRGATKKPTKKAVEEAPSDDGAEDAAEEASTAEAPAEDRMASMRARLKAKREAAA